MTNQLFNRHSNSQNNLFEREKEREREVERGRERERERRNLSKPSSRTQAPAQFEHGTGLRDWGQKIVAVFCVEN